ncbi:MAG: apolipoprotein N-acyltransferase [Burkholderiaceae bacterium]
MLVLALPSRFPLRFLIALALGALHAAAFINDATWPLAIAALAGLVALASEAAREITGVVGSRRAGIGGANVGFGFGLGWFLTGVSWIYISLHTYGEMNALVAGLAVLLFSAYLAIYPALACAAFAWFRHARAPGLIASVAMFAALWSLSEIGRGFVFTGFPWLASGYAHVAGPLAGYAPLLGVYGVSLCAAAIAAAIALAAGSATRRRSRSHAAPRLRSRLLTMLAVVFGLPILGSALTTIAWSNPAGAPIIVRLLQGNVAQELKFARGRFDGIAEDYMKRIEAKRADLIVLPETAFPRFLANLPEQLGQRLAHDAREMNAAIAFGIPIREGEEGYFNSVVALTPHASADAAAAAKSEASPPASTEPFALVDAQRYDKSHLVPFGEFIPLGFHWFVRMMNMPLGDFSRGSIDQRPMHLAGQRVAFNVCYEDLFGEEIIRQAGEANILVNVSNVAWFGDSMALPQHLDISRMRAIETARPMLRATNTGMTASIDPHGRVLAQLAPFPAGSLDVSVQGMTGLTPYTRFGNATILVVIAVLLGGSLLSRRGRPRRDPNDLRSIDLM